MRTITALFDDHDQADAAVRALRDAGIAADDISIVARHADGRIEDNGDEIAEDAGTGAGIGAAVGGTGGLLAGLGMLAIPGIGPVVAGGWLLSTAIGAATGAVVGGATGGIVGALTTAGINERDAHVYAEGVRRGDVLVTARVDEFRADAAQAILNRAQAVDIETRRSAFEAEGWERFDENADPYTPDRMREYRAGLVPPIV